MFGTGSVKLNNSLITTSTSNSENAGKIDLTAPTINLNLSNVRSNTQGSGSAGIINLTGDNITLSNNSGLGVNTTSTGAGGTINIKGGNLTVVNNSGGGSNTRGEGNAGTINITADKFLIQNQAAFGADSFSSGAAGNINITAREFITRQNSGLGSQAKSSGAGGNINITTNNLLIENYSGFSTGTSPTGTGNAGKMSITVLDSAVIRNYAGVGAQTDGKGDGGEMKFVAGANEYFADECVIFKGTLNLGRNILKTPWIPGAYLDEKNLRCSAYYNYFGQYLLNNRYFYLSLAELIRRKDEILEYFNSDSEAFIRPDSNMKPFNAGVFNLKALNTIKALKSELNTNDTTLVLVSRKQPITKEWRFFVYKNQVITGSLYLVGEERIDETIKGGYLENYVNQVLASVNWYPEALYTIDICEAQGELYVLELGSYSCAGEYGCDLSLIIEAGAKAAIEEYTANL